jgi:hypothetical protein
MAGRIMGSWDYRRSAANFPLRAKKNVQENILRR